MIPGISFLFIVEEKLFLAAPELVRPCLVIGCAFGPHALLSEQLKTVSSAPVL
jgi:hypothetical protein